MRAVIHAVIDNNSFKKPLKNDNKLDVRSNITTTTSAIVSDKLLMKI
jgi:hypothetical protein